MIMVYDLDELAEMTSRAVDYVCALEQDLINSEFVRLTVYAPAGVVTLTTALVFPMGAMLAKLATIAEQLAAAMTWQADLE